MPVSAVETIRHTAIEHTSRMGEEVRSLPWTDGLSRLEDYLTSTELLYIGPRGLRPQEAEALVNAIAGDSGFMIALVFSHDHKKVVALPLPEVHEDYPRTELGGNRSDHPATDLAKIRESILIASVLSENITPCVQQDVVLIEKNLGNRRKSYPITVATLDKQTNYLQKEQYMDWIQRTQADLNGTPATS